LPRNQAKKRLEVITRKEGMEFLGWREVPTRPEILGSKARSCMPHIAQCFVRRPADAAPGLEFDKRLYLVRREFEQSNENTYVASFSSRTIVYKGMFLVGQLRNFRSGREVPTRPEILGSKARSCMPHIAQCFVRRPADAAPGLEFDKRLYLVRREFEQSNENTYVASFSSRTIVYKGMFLVGQLRNF